MKYRRNIVALSILAGLGLFAAVLVADGSRTPAFAMQDDEWRLELEATPSTLILPNGEREAIMQVSVAHSATTGIDNVLVFCPPPTGGEIVTVTEPGFAPKLDDSVLGAIWVGSLEPTGTLAFSYTVSPAGALSGMSPECHLYLDGERRAMVTETVRIVPWQRLFPFVVVNYTSPPPPVAPTVITVPLQYRVGSSAAMAPFPPSHDIAFNAAGYFYSWGAEYSGIIQVGNSEFSDAYIIDRSYLLAIVPDLGGKSVLSASLHLVGDGVCTTTVQLGTWPGSGLPDLPQYWQAYGGEIGAIVDYSREYHSLEVPLDPAGIVAGQALKMVLRAQDHLLAGEACPEAGYSGFVAVGDCDGPLVNHDMIPVCFDPYLRIVVR